MKRLPSIFLLLTIAVTVFAEEQFTSNPQIRLGGHITSQFPAGNMSPYANAAVGLGADVLFFFASFDSCSQKHGIFISCTMAVF